MAEQRLFASALIIAAVVLPPRIVSAASITISDLTDAAPSVTTSGFDPATLSITTVPEDGSLHGEYVSTTPPPVGTVTVLNFNLSEFTGGPISDVLSVTLTGRNPSSSDLNNVSVDLNFRSDGEGGPVIDPLPRVFLVETGAFQDLSDAIVSLGGPSDFHVSVASDAPEVPEPASLMLVGTGLVFVGRKLRSSRNK
jgi:hypothetical protein